MKKTLMVFIALFLISNSSSIHSMTLFDYDSQVPLPVQEVSVTKKDDVRYSVFFNHPEQIVDFERFY